MRKVGACMCRVRTAGGSGFLWEEVLNYPLEAIRKFKVLIIFIGPILAQIFATRTSPDLCLLSI